MSDNKSGSRKGAYKLGKKNADIDDEISTMGALWRESGDSFSPRLRAPGHVPIMHKGQHGPDAEGGKSYHCQSSATSSRRLGAIATCPRRQ